MFYFFMIAAIVEFILIVIMNHVIQRITKVAVTRKTVSGVMHKLLQSDYVHVFEVIQGAMDDEDEIVTGRGLSVEDDDFNRVIQIDLSEKEYDVLCDLKFRME